MSFFHFDATTAAAASQIQISLSPIFISEGTFPTATVSVGFFGDGEVWGDDGASAALLYNWIDPADAATLPGTVPWEISRSAHINDDPGSPNAGVWTQLLTSNDLGLPTATNGGTGYTNGDLVTMVGGDIGTGGFAATFKVQNVVGGVVPASNGLTTAGGGSLGGYFQAPNDAHGLTTVSYTGGTGNGLESYARFSGIEWGIGAGYPGSAFSEFTVSIRKGSGPVLATTTVELEADAS